MKKIKLFNYCFLFIAIKINGFSQKTILGNPNEYLLIKDIPKIEIIHEFNIINNSNNYKSILKKKKIADKIEVDYSPQNCGIWDTLADGFKIWRVGFYCKTATALSITFNDFYLEKYAKVFLYDEKKEQVIGALSSLNNKTSRILPTSFIIGNYLYLELQVEPSCNNFGILNIGGISISDQIISNSKLKSTQTGICGTDIHCFDNPIIPEIKNGICKIIINGEVKCTGALINTTAYSGVPYILTANHCITNNNDAANSVFYFNLESTGCGCITTLQTKSISGAELIATNNQLDFSLVKLSLYPDSSYNPHYLGWNRKIENFSNVLSIHQPDGNIKNLAFEFDQIQRVTFDDVVDYFADSSHFKIREWDIGTTISGSSGAPLFDKNGKIIGALSGGEANCYNPINDYFAMFSLAWDYNIDSLKQLKHWLDPINSGDSIISSFQPYNFTSPAPKNCVTILKNEITKSANQIEIFPNPVIDYLSIKFLSGFNYNTKLNIYTINGMLIKQYMMPKNTNEIKVDMNELREGLYLLRIEGINKNYKIIKQQLK